MADKPKDLNDPNEFRFNLGEAYKYDRFPMKRLSEYLKEIAGLFSEEHENLYFIRLEAGSAIAVVRVDPEDVHLVTDDLSAVVRGEALPTQLAHFRRFHTMLEEDASLHDVEPPEPAKIIQFPGAIEYPETNIPDFGWITEFEQLDGIPVEVGGSVTHERKFVTLKMRDGNVKKVYMGEDLANEIKQYLWHSTIRVEGKAKFKRDAHSGKWQMREFRVAHYTLLRETTLSEDIQALRELPLKWKDLDDPLRDLHIIRHEDDKIQ